MHFGRGRRLLAVHYRNWVKRVLDFSLAATLLVLLAPLLAVLSALVRRKVGTPPLYRQTRLGYQGQVFTIYKFRTMSQTRNQAGELLPDSQRLTPFGRLLRNSSLDELPQLYNVLRGEMSLVGPRPLLVKYRNRYTAQQWRRHSVRPGITGWAVVRGRNNQTWESMFAADVEYADGVSFCFDLKIVLLTVATIFDRSGIERKAGETFEFWGLETPPAGLDVHACGATEEG